MTAIDWSVLTRVKSAIADGSISALSSRFVVTNPAHSAVLLQLTAAERRALLGNARLLSIFAFFGREWALAGRSLDALALFDDVIETRAHFDYSLYANALYAVTNANHHLGVMPERARTYLARATPFARHCPAIFHNAACVAAELGEREKAVDLVRDAVRFGYDNLPAIANDVALAPLRSDPRFSSAFQDEALLLEWHQRRLPTASSEHAVDWSTVFEKAQPKAGASEPELTLLRDLWTPLDESDEPYFREPKAFETAKAWPLTGALPPTAYLDFLRFSNGGSFRNGARRFNAFFETHALRPMMLQYAVPEHMPAVLPFAFDGGGVFYAFDMRAPASDAGEFPIIAFHSSTPVWEEAVVVAESFEAACRGKSAI